MAMFLCVLKSDNYLRHESKCGGQYRVANIGRIDVKFIIAPAFKPGVTVGCMFWALAKRKILLVAKAESIVILHPPAEAEGN
jgi:hypothetical protein